MRWERKRSRGQFPSTVEFPLLRFFIFETEFWSRSILVLNLFLVFVSLSLYLSLCFLLAFLSMADLKSTFLNVYSVLKAELLQDPAFEYTDASRQWIERVTSLILFRFFLFLFQLFMLCFSTLYVVAISRLISSSWIRKSVLLLCSGWICLFMLIREVRFYHVRTALWVCVTDVSLTVFILSSCGSEREILISSNLILNFAVLR